MSDTKDDMCKCGHCGKWAPRSAPRCTCRQARTPNAARNMMRRVLELMAEGIPAPLAIEQAVAEVPGSPGSRRLAAKILAARIAAAITPADFRGPEGK